MNCVFCEHGDTKVVDKRETESGKATRRRRECLKCGRRFTTYEKADVHPIVIVKKDNTREQFSREKLRMGMIRACEKRPISTESIDKELDKIEISLKKKGKTEIKSREVGEYVMRALKRLDKVAYIRFASVYKDFQDVETFKKEIQKLAK